MPAFMRAFLFSTEDSPNRAVTVRERFLEIQNRRVAQRNKDLVPQALLPVLPFTASPNISSSPYQPLTPTAPLRCQNRPLRWGREVQVWQRISKQPRTG